MFTVLMSSKFQLSKVFARSSRAYKALFASLEAQIWVMRCESFDHQVRQDKRSIHHSNCNVGDLYNREDPSPKTEKWIRLGCLTRLQWKKNPKHIKQSHFLLFPKCDAPIKKVPITPLPCEVRVISHIICIIQYSQTPKKSSNYQEFCGFQ